MQSRLGGGGGDPPPPDGAPCTGCTKYSGSLSYTGDRDAQPNGKYYSSGAGTQRGWLTGPASADFDIELYRWSGSGWVKVAEGISPSSTETVQYNGSAGYYYWRVLSYSGSGAYNFYLAAP